MPLSCSVVLCRALLMPLPKGRCPSLFCCCLSALPCSAAAFLPFLVLLLPFCGKADAFACGGRWRSLAKALPLPCVSNTSTAEPVPFPCLFRAKDRRPSLHFCSTPLRRAGGGGWGWGGLRNQRDDTQIFLLFPRRQHCTQSTSSLHTEHTSPFSSVPPTAHATMSYTAQHAHITHTPLTGLRAVFWTWCIVGRGLTPC